MFFYFKKYLSLRDDSLSPRPFKSLSADELLYFLGDLSFFRLLESPDLFSILILAPSAAANGPLLRFINAPTSEKVDFFSLSKMVLDGETVISMRLGMAAFLAGGQWGGGLGLESTF